MFNRKSALVAALLVLGAACAGSAQAGNVQWSVGINLPPVGTVISSEPVYQPAPEPYYYPPAPVYVQPAPVVVYRPAPVYAPVYAPRYYEPPVIRSAWVVPGYGWHHGHREWREEHRDERHHDRRDEYGEHRNDDRWAPEPRRQHR